MKKTLTLGWVLIALLFSACVTINIYFPAAAAEKAADQIIEEIQGETPAEDSSQPHAGGGWHRRVLSGLLNLVIPPAQAAEADLSIDSPEIRRLSAAMKQHFEQLRPFLDQGLVGIGKNALLVVRDPGRVPLKDRNRVKKLVAAENADREALYRAIANANGHPEWEADIRATFARRWVANAFPGWWYQDPSGRWLQK